jgi:hypothetical protein
MNDFPRMLYKAGGPEPIHGGHFFTLIVNDADELETALASGWAMTTPEAVEAAKPKAAPVPDDYAPATREELERKANELQIKFDGRTSDKKLADLIAATIEE